MSVNFQHEWGYVQEDLKEIIKVLEIKNPVVEKRFKQYTTPNIVTVYHGTAVSVKGKDVIKFLCVQSVELQGKKMLCSVVQ